MAIMDITDIEPLFMAVKPYYHYHRNFFIVFETFFIKSINESQGATA